MLREAHRQSCVGTGFIVLDVIRNTIETTVTEKRFAGGSCGNVLSILAYLGWDSNAVGRIGDDHVGRELIADLNRWHVNTNLLQVEIGRATPVIVQENYLDSKGRPRHRFSRACPTCGAALPVYRPVLSSSAAAITTKMPPHSVFFYDRVAPGPLELARKSRENGALVVFEPSGIKDEKLFAECLRTAHVVKYANDRLDGVHDLVAKVKVPVEIETLGDKGLRFRMCVNRHAGEWKDIKAYSAPVLRDASGSGDWTTAGLIHGLMCRRTSAENAVAGADAIMKAIRQGQALAALNCGFEGARGLMYVAEATRILNLAASITKGIKKPRIPELKGKARISGRTSYKVCLTCSGDRALHA